MTLKRTPLENALLDTAYKYEEIKKAYKHSEAAYVYKEKENSDLRAEFNLFKLQSKAQSEVHQRNFEHQLADRSKGNFWQRISDFGKGFAAGYFTGKIF